MVIGVDDVCIKSVDDVVDVFFVVGGFGGFVLLGKNFFLVFWGGVD